MNKEYATDGMLGLNNKGQRAERSYTQALASVEHPSFDSVRCNAADVGGIADRSSAVVDQIDDFAMRWGQLR